ncbi:hypothetical protein Tco_0412001 [Tanacetum coccineum]
MGHGTWYYSLGVSSIVDAFVSSRVDGRSYLQSGAIDGSEANGIIRDSKKEVVEMIVGVGKVGGSNGSTVCGKRLYCLVGRKMRMVTFEVYGYAFWVNQCTSGFHGVNEPGGVRVAREDDRGVTEGREDVCKVFQQRRSGAKRKLSRCGRNQLGNEPILALPEGADDFVVYYDARSKDLEACLEKKEKVIACTSRQLKVLKKNCMTNVVGLLLQPELLEYKWGRITEDIVVKSPSGSTRYDAIRV